MVFGEGFFKRFHTLYETNKRHYACGNNKIDADLNLVKEATLTSSEKSEIASTSFGLLKACDKKPVAVFKDFAFFPYMRFVPGKDIDGNNVINQSKTLLVVGSDGRFVGLVANSGFEFTASIDKLIVYPIDKIDKQGVIQDRKLDKKIRFQYSDDPDMVFDLVEKDFKNMKPYFKRGYRLNMIYEDQKIKVEKTSQTTGKKEHEYIDPFERNEERRF